MSKTSFNSKILLFGEYSVIYDSSALTIPYSLFSGSLVFPDHSANNYKVQESNEELKAFAQFLKRSDHNGEINLSEYINLGDLQFDIEQGLYFNSSIPQGYGLGSSGALCAAIYDAYKIKEIDTEIDLLKRVFGFMESHFHGSSSGFDPLISYLGIPLLLCENKTIEKINLSSSQQGDGALFLLNTARARRTEPLVNLFLEKCRQPEFEIFIRTKYFKATNNCIDNFLKKDFDSLYSSFSLVSKYQYEEFLPMIPKMQRELWENGLSNDLFSLKLCGAGGGGFILGITKDFQQTKNLLKDFELRSIWKF